jgi:hypothetical protein
MKRRSNISPHRRINQSLLNLRERERWSKCGSERERNREKEKVRKNERENKKD